MDLVPMALEIKNGILNIVVASFIALVNVVGLALATE
jgi:hypothetical protein